jgi:hypothetical protein
MSSATPATPHGQPGANPFVGTHGERPQQSDLFSGLLFEALRKATGWVPNTELSKSESESTLFRFFRSKHVRDLKLICAIAVFLSHLAVVLLIGLLDALNVFFFPPPRPDQQLWVLRERGVSAISEFVSFLFKTSVQPPARAERLIVDLLTELKCFSFLRNHFTPEDLRWRRLQLREADYRQQVLDVYDEVMLAPHGHNAKDWLPAERTIPDLASRYHEALGDDLVAACKARQDARNGRLEVR